MSTKYAPSLRLDLKPSLFFIWLTVMFHGLAMAACLFNALPLVLRLFGFLVVVFSFRQSLKQNRNASCVIELSFSDSSGWTIVDDTGRLPIDLLASTISTAWMIVLHFRPQKQSKQTLLIFRDAITVEEYRKLRVALRIATTS